MTVRCLLERLVERGPLPVHARLLLVQAVVIAHLVFIEEADRGVQEFNFLSVIVPAGPRVRP